jgi:hypothetical protein
MFTDNEKPANGKFFTWQENVTGCAQRLSQKIEEAFTFELRASTEFLPFKHFKKDSTKAKMESQIKLQLEILLDYVIGTVVALAGETISKDQGFEEIFINIVRDKFERLRKIRGQDGDHQA